MLRSTNSLALAALLLAPSMAASQTRQPVSVQGSAVYVGVSGDSYQGLQSGMGAEAQVRFTPNAWSFGIGLQSTSHDIEESILYGTSTLRGVFFEPRYVLSTPSTRLFPYLSGRAVFVRQSSSAIGIDSHAYGTQMNLGGGVLVRIASNLNLDVGTTVGWIRFGKPELDRNPDNVEFVDSFRTSGKDVLLRLGLAVGVGK